MPAFTYHRQPGAPRPAPLDWFGASAGRGLLASEDGAIGRVLAMCPALPWLWVGVSAAEPPEAPRGVCLQPVGGGFTGDLHCRLPLPVASECFGAIFLQHVLDDACDVQAMLDECARVLAPGGTLWLATLNPWSPYRARWTGVGLHARVPGRWQAAVRRAGFSPGSTRVQWLGPHWRPGPADAGIGLADRFRAGLALSAGKQVLAANPPAALRQLRWQVGRWRLSCDSEHRAARPIGPGQG